MRMGWFTNRPLLFAAAVFALLSAVFTFPLVFKMHSAIPGFFSTDEPSLWYLWWVKHAALTGADPAFSRLIAYPFGLDFSLTEKMYPVWIFIKKMLVYATNPFISYNIEILASFLLSGFFAYCLSRYLIRNEAAALFTGVVYAFCPYHFARAWQHIGLAHIQWLPLLLLTLFILAKKDKLRISLPVALSVFAIFAFDLYYAYFSALIVAVFILYLLFSKTGNKKIPVFNTLISVSTGFAVSCLMIAPFLLRVFSRKAEAAGAWSVTLRPFEDLFSQSARPLSYLLPSPAHPLLGRITESFIGSSLYGTSFTEHVLYLGWTPLVLAFFAFRAWRKKEAKAERVGFFVFLALAAWLFSQPPWWRIGPLKIYMPSFFMYKALPMFRAYCRFGVVVMLAVAVLAGYGFRHFLEGFKGVRLRACAGALLFLLACFEFWNYPPFRVLDYSQVPAVYYWLKVQPADFAIAEYPLDIDGPNELYKFHQSVHEKKIINGTVPSTEANLLSRKITRLSEPGVAGILRWMGVKYVLVHREAYLDTELAEDVEELNSIPRNPGLKLVCTFDKEECLASLAMCAERFSTTDVYEVTAAAARPEGMDIK